MVGNIFTQYPPSPPYHHHHHHQQQQQQQHKKASYGPALRNYLCFVTRTKYDLFGDEKTW